MRRFWAIPVLASVLILGTLGISQDAFALDCESTQNGFWDVSGTWTGCGDGVPGNGDNITIKNGHIVTVGDVQSVDATVTVESGAQLIIDGAAGGELEIKNLNPIFLGFITIGRR